MINFFNIQEDLLDHIKSGTYSINIIKYFQEAMEREFAFDNMPLVNIRHINADSEVRSIPNGYFFEVNYLVDIVCFSFTHFKLAAQVRDTLAKEIALRIQTAAQFSEEILTVSISGRWEFSAGVLDGQNGHVASVTIPAIVEAEIDAS